MRSVVHSSPELFPASATDNGTHVQYSVRTVGVIRETDAKSTPPVPLPTEESAEPGNRVLQLDEVIRLALSSSPDLQSAAERTWIAHAALRRARAEFFPTLGVAENYGASNSPVNAFSFVLNQAQLNFNQDFNNPGTIDNFDTRLRVKQGVFAGGRRRAEKRAAEWQLQASHAGLKTVRNQLVFQTAEAYYRLLQAAHLVSVREEAVRQVKHHLEIVRTRFRAETAVKSDVLTVEVRLAEAREALITARHQVELTWAVLDNVVGQQIKRRDLPKSVPAAPWSNRIEDVQQAVATALRHRPETGAAGSQYQSALYGVEAARAGKRPALNFVGDYDVFTGDFRRGNDSFFVGLVLELNLIDSGRTRSDVDRASARARELAARYRRTVLDIELDVRRAFLKLDNAEARLKVTAQAVGQAKESLREIEVRYRGQTATITQLIDAQVALSNVRVRRTTAQADVEIARASLERAVGRIAGVANRP